MIYAADTFRVTDFPMQRKERRDTRKIQNARKRKKNDGRMARVRSEEYKVSHGNKSLMKVGGFKGDPGKQHNQS